MLSDDDGVRLGDGQPCGCDSGRKQRTFLTECVQANDNQECYSLNKTTGWCMQELFKVGLSLNLGIALKELKQTPSELLNWWMKVWCLWQRWTLTSDTTKRLRSRRQLTRMEQHWKKKQSIWDIWQPSNLMSGFVHKICWDPRSLKSEN